MGIESELSEFYKGELPDAKVFNTSADFFKLISTAIDNGEEITPEKTTDLIGRAIQKELGI